MRVMTQSDLIGNDERSSEMAVRRGEILGQYFARTSEGK
jgi:hypothetical protein